MRNGREHEHQWSFRLSQIFSRISLYTRLFMAYLVVINEEKKKELIRQVEVSRDKNSTFSISPYFIKTVDI